MQKWCTSWENYLLWRWSSHKNTINVKNTIDINHILLNKGIQDKAQYVMYSSNIPVMYASAWPGPVLYIFFNIPLLIW